MVKWYPELYLDDKTKKHIKKIKRTIEQKKALENVYCICQPRNPKNLFDIIGVKELLYPYYEKDEVIIFGIAYGKEEAYRLLEGMMLEVYQNTDDFDVKRYFTYYAD